MQSDAGQSGKLTYIAGLYLVGLARIENDLFSFLNYHLSIWSDFRQGPDLAILVL